MIAYATPTSLLPGQYFKAQRELLASEAPPVTLDVVEPRHGVFEGVLQETMLSVYRRGGEPTSAEVNRITVSSDSKARVFPVGPFQLPAHPSAPW